MLGERRRAARYVAAHIVAARAPRQRARVCCNDDVETSPPPGGAVRFSRSSLCLSKAPLHATLEPHNNKASHTLPAAAQPASRPRHIRTLNTSATPWTRRSASSARRRPRRRCLASRSPSSTRTSACAVRCCRCGGGGSGVEWGAAGHTCSNAAESQLACARQMDKAARRALPRILTACDPPLHPSQHHATHPLQNNNKQ